MPVLRYYNVFNANQCDGIETPDAVEYNPLDFKPIEAAEAIVKEYSDAPSIEYGGQQAYYRPLTDIVRLPEPSRFTSAEEYYSTLFHELGHSTGHTEWETVLLELEALAECDPSDPTTGKVPQAPKFTEAGFTEIEINKICSRVKPETWIDLSLISLSDQPKFEYRTREDQYIPFADASAGQQATALLFTLLNQDGPPLIIDQPEDDLDNQVILKVVEQIWKAKQRRQLLFSSHNANLVVNGDAELVICCDYRAAADQSGGKVKKEGAIDMDTIRAEITTVMEGGHEAFKLRKAKYGF